MDSNTSIEMMDWQFTPPAAELDIVHSPVMLERRRPRDEFEIPNMPGGWIEEYTERRIPPLFRDCVVFKHQKPSIITYAKQAVGQAKRRCVQIAISAFQAPTHLFTFANNTKQAVYQIVRRVRQVQAARRRRPGLPRRSPRTSPRSSPRAMAPRHWSPAAANQPRLPSTPKLDSTPSSPAMASALESAAVGHPRSSPFHPRPRPLAFDYRSAVEPRTPESPSPVTYTYTFPANRPRFDPWDIAPSPPQTTTTDCHDQSTLFSSPSSSWLHVPQVVSFFQKIGLPEPGSLTPYIAPEDALRTQYDESLSVCSEGPTNTEEDQGISVTTQRKSHPSYLEGSDAEFSSTVPDFSPEPSSFHASPSRMKAEADILPDLPGHNPEASPIDAPTMTSKPKMLTPRKPYPSYLEGNDSDFSSNVDFSPPEVTMTSTPKLPTPRKPYPSYLEGNDSDFSSNVDYSPEVTFHLDTKVYVDEFSSNVPFAPEVEDDLGIPDHVENVADANEGAGDDSNYVLQNTSDVANAIEGAAHDSKDLVHVTEHVTHANEGADDHVHRSIQETKDVADAIKGADDDSSYFIQVADNVADANEGADDGSSYFIQVADNVADANEGADNDFQDSLHETKDVADANEGADDDTHDFVQNDQNIVHAIEGADHDSEDVLQTTENFANANEGAGDDISYFLPNFNDVVDAIKGADEGSNCFAHSEHLATAIEGADEDANYFLQHTNDVANTIEGVNHDIKDFVHSEYLATTVEDVYDTKDFVHSEYLTTVIEGADEDSSNVAQTNENVHDVAEENHDFSSYMLDFDSPLVDYSPGLVIPIWYEQTAQKPLTRNPDVENRRMTRGALREQAAEEQRKEKQRQDDLAKAKISALTEEWENQVQDAVRMGFSSYKASDFARVVPSRSGRFTDSWLNDESVNGYLKLITDFHNGRHSSPVPKSHAFSSFMFKKIAERGYAGVERWAKKAKIGGADLLKTHSVFIPVNDGSHWTLMVVYPEGRTAHYYDSMGRNRYDNGRRWFDLVKIWLRGELGDLYDEREWSFADKESPQQNNSSDCGVFAITTAKMLILGAPVLGYGPADIPLQRRRIVAELVNGNFL